MQEKTPAKNYKKTAIYTNIPRIKKAEEALRPLFQKIIQLKSIYKPCKPYRILLLAEYRGRISHRAIFSAE